MKPVVDTKHKQHWKYETKQFTGVCVIAKDVMIIKCSFEYCAKKFFDVLEIDSLIKKRLKDPVSVEGMLDYLIPLFPKDMKITVSGCAKTHGWITCSK